MKDIADRPEVIPDGIRPAGPPPRPTSGRRADRAPAGDPRPASMPWRQLTAARPLLFAALVGLVVLGIHLAALAADAHPRSGRTEYGLHSAAMIVAATAVAAVWWARRTGRTWDADLLPALFAGLAGLTMLIALHGTPFDVYGLQGDQSFRTAMVTRFADTWQIVDYTYRDLPGYYAPGYFWLLGRAAAVAGVAPWHMLKFGAIAVAFAVPLVSYLCWRRLVTPRTAALISAVPLIVPDLYESYGWVVQLAIIPWWLEAVHGLTRPGLRRRNPVLLGLIGAALFCVYYYYFFVFVLVFAMFLAVRRCRGELSWQETRRSLAVLGIAALGSAIFWAPLAWNFLTAPHFESLNNRWITLNSGDLALPMLEPSVVGALCLLGLVYLLLTAREALSRSLLLVLVALYLWHALGFLFLALDIPLMSFRMKTLVPLVLLAAAALGLVRGARWTLDRLPAPRIWPVVAVGAGLLALMVGDGFVNRVVDDPRIHAAHNETLPDGTLPPFHDDDKQPALPAATRVDALIEATYRGAGHPVVLSDRTHLFAFQPYYGFVQWNANYSHPAAQYHRRLEFLEEAARAASPADFAAQTGDNPYDRIDAIVLRADGDNLVYRTYDDDFPFGSKARTITIPGRLVTLEYFDVTRIDGYVVAVRRAVGS
ncbi:arabinofuranosyltransferase [Micromonospora sp. NPDC006766]|uniref:arabinofuranosyltransferase n=1 Tax=Micromonospora sp. NPDC006766 TaxID=3154778 RepID=UPI0033F11D05